MRQRLAVLQVTLGIMLMLLGTAKGQSQPTLGAGEGISVYGVGEVPSRPNVIELDLHVSGKAELTGDALVKYRDAKKRVNEALEKVKANGVTLEEHGVSISVGNSDPQQQQRIINGQAQVAGKPQVEVSSELRVRLTGIRDLPAEDTIKLIGKLMDTAADSGVNIGPNPAEVLRAARYGQLPQSSGVRFVIADVAAVREKAYEKAVTDARTRALRLAKLHQVKLGAATSIQEIQVAGDQQAPPSTIIAYQPVMQGPNDYEGDEPRLVVSSLSGANVQVKLLVRFAIETSGPATAQQ